MDVARKHGTRWRWLRRGLFLLVTALLLGAATYAFSTLKRAAPVVDADSVWTAAVERGELLRQVRGNGTLAPAEVRWIPALVEGRVENIPHKPGETVSEETVLIELSNPVLERDLLNAEWELGAAEAGRRNLETDIESQQLSLQETIAVTEGEMHIAKLQADRDKKLFEEGLSAKNILDVSVAQLEGNPSHTLILSANSQGPRNQLSGATPNRILFGNLFRAPILSSTMV
jgi:HlyD family secretion protein